ncbi:hypothetical protein D3C80_1370570 [compost metagenome]
MTADREFARNDRAFGVGFTVQGMGNRPDHRLCSGWLHLTCRLNAMAQPFDENPAIRVEHDFDNGWVVQGDA